MPGAWAIGYRAYRPMMIVARAADRHVAVVMEPKSMPVLELNMPPESTAGCTTMM